MKGIIILNFTICLLFYQLPAQDWVEIGGGLDGQVRTLYADTSHHLLYVGGDFIHAGGLTVNRIAKWNNISWDSLGSGSYGLGVFEISSYRDTIIAAGNFINQMPDYNYLAKWDGFRWDSLGIGVDATVYSFEVISDTLFVGGNFDHADTISSYLLAKWDGENWHGCNLPFERMSGPISDIQLFQDSIYISGELFDSTNVLVNNIAILNQDQLLEVGTELNNPSNATISKMIVYNGGLYIAGSFGTGTSGLGNNIVKWDGQVFSSVGGGTNDGILDMVVFNDELYVVGVFSMAGGVNTQSIARWDGQSWHSIGSNSTFWPSSISNIAVLDNELYIGGGFTQINPLVNPQILRGIAKYVGPLGINATETEIVLSVFPNPVNQNLRVVSNSLNIIKIKLLNNLNQEIESFIVRSKEISIDVSIFSPGLYFLQIQTTNGTAVKKYVKE